jgi:nucleoside-diphosphate-sugar epimerase
MRILVIGGTGFIGPHVVRRLSSLGHRVTVGHTGQHEVDLPPEVEHLHHPSLARVGRDSIDAVGSDIDRLQPDVVLDMAPLTEADARLLLNLVRGKAGRVVAISSQDVYRAYGVLIGKEPGPLEPMPLTEDSPLRPSWYPYRGEKPKPADDPRRWTDDYDKIPIERAFLETPELPGTILRLPAVHGPRDGHRIFDHLKRMDDSRPVILLEERVARWRWTRGYVENVAHAIALAVVDERSSGRIYNVADPVAYPEAEWVRKIGRIAGWHGQVVVLPTERLPAHLRQTENVAQDLVADSSRIRDELGYVETIDEDEGLRRTIAWERSAPPDVFDPALFDYAAEDAALA